MIGDRNWRLRNSTTLLPASAGSTSEGRTPADNLTVRTLFVIGRTRRSRRCCLSMSTGRNFAEILRILDSLAADGESWGLDSGELATWGRRRGAAAMSEEDVKKKFPEGIRTLKPYLRMGSSRVVSFHS